MLLVLFVRMSLFTWSKVLFPEFILQRCQYLRWYSLFVLGATAPSGPGPPHSRGFQITHNDAPQSVGLLWTSDQLVAETSTWQHTSFVTEFHAPGGIRTHNLSRRTVPELRLRPRDHCDRHLRRNSVDEWVSGESKLMMAYLNQEIPCLVWYPKINKNKWLYYISRDIPVLIYGRLSPSKLCLEVTLGTCIRDGNGLNFGGVTDYRAEVFHGGFFWSFQANSGIAPQLRSRSLPSMPLPINF